MVKLASLYIWVELSHGGVDGGENPSQQSETLPVPQVPIRLMNIWNGRLDEIIDPSRSKCLVIVALKLKELKVS